VTKSDPIGKQYFVCNQCRRSKQKKGGDRSLKPKMLHLLGDAIQNGDHFVGHCAGCKPKPIPAIHAEDVKRAACKLVRQGDSTVVYVHDNAHKKMMSACADLNIDVRQSRLCWNEQSVKRRLRKAKKGWSC
jgi:hypothetical protein